MTVRDQAGTGRHRPAHAIVDTLLTIVDIGPFFEKSVFRGRPIFQSPFSVPACEIDDRAGQQFGRGYNSLSPVLDGPGRALWTRSPSRMRAPSDGLCAVRRITGSVEETVWCMRV